MNTKQVGMTLIELTVVLLILVALAGLAIPYVSGVSRASLCKATDVSMDNIKRAIMDGFYMDTLGYFPKNTKTAAATDFNLTYLFEKSTNFTAFNPSTGIGWRGAYLTTGIRLNNITIGSTFIDSGNANSHVHDNLTDNHFAPLDSWGNPIIIQRYDDANKGFRLVSAGFNGELETKITDPGIGGDDRVLYINKPAPEMSPSCDE